MILADSSVWIDHFRTPIDALPRFIGAGELRIHPYVICELALGSVPDRRNLLSYLLSLPSFAPSGTQALLDFVDGHALHGTGIGMIDAELLKCSVESETRLWTSDKRLLIQAEHLGVAFRI